MSRDFDILGVKEFRPFRVEFQGFSGFRSSEVSGMSLLARSRAGC